MKHTVNTEQAIILVLKLSFDGNYQADRQKSTLQGQHSGLELISLSI